MIKKKDYSGFGKVLLTATFLLLACLSSLADDVKEFTLTTAGTLSTAVGDEKLTITKLKVSGPINGADFLCIREMAGRDVNGTATEGKLVDLDLSGADIVTDDTPYYKTHTINAKNTLGDYVFYNCDQLTSVTLPNSATSISIYAFCGCN